MCGLNATLTGAFLSIGLMTNFLSLKEMFRISLQGKPIFGVNLNEILRKGLTVCTFKHPHLHVHIVGCSPCYKNQPADGAQYERISLQEVMTARGFQVSVSSDSVGCHGHYPTITTIIVDAL